MPRCGGEMKLVRGCCVSVPGCSKGQTSHPPTLAAPRRAFSQAGRSKLSLLRGGWDDPNCARPTKTFRGRALREQENGQATPPIFQRPAKIVRLVLRSAPRWSLHQTPPRLHHPQDHSERRVRQSRAVRKSRPSRATLLRSVRAPARNRRVL